jgi:hypothetical protein
VTPARADAAENARNFRRETELFITILLDGRNSLAWDAQIANSIIVKRNPLVNGQSQMIGLSRFWVQDFLTRG